MNQEYKIKMLVMAVIALALLNITTILTVFLKQNQESGRVMGKMIDEKEVNYKGHFFTFYLQFDSLQVERFKEVNEYYLMHKRRYSESIGELTVDLAGHINSKGAREGEFPYYKSIIENHRQLKYENYKFYIAVRDICNETQKELLDSFFSSILCIDNSLCSFLEYSEEGEPLAVVKPGSDILND
jgi:hypothetical protein